MLFRWNGCRLFKFAAVALAAMIVAGCGSGATTPASLGPTARHIVGPGGVDVAVGNAAPAAPAADGGTQAAAQINDFGFDLLRNLDPKANLVVSPASIALALGMVRPGARGVTAAEMDKVLHSFGADGQSSEIAALLDGLGRQNLDSLGRSMSSPGPSGHPPTIELDVNDEAFIEKTLSVEQSYLDSLSQSFNAGVALVDYKNNAEAARLLINKWASDKTQGRIPSILGPSDIDGSTRLVLVNAIYLKAAWETQFDPGQTADRTFTTAEGTAEQVPTMAIDSGFDYAEGTGYEIVDLPYSFGGMSMTVVVPDDMASFIDGLTASELRSMIAAEVPAVVDLQLPKFSIETRTELADVLTTLGMGSAFGRDADFSGITSREPLSISKVIHQANIDVVETGTTAAAVTAVPMAAASQPAPPRKVTFHVDKPFLYFIHDNRSGAVLFMGRVNDPTAK